MGGKAEDVALDRIGKGVCRQDSRGESHSFGFNGRNDASTHHEIEGLFLADRTAKGIPLDDGNWQALLKLAGELNVTVPSVA